MNDIAKYIRKALVTALKDQGVNAYNMIAPSDAVAPYVVVTVSYESVANKCFNSYRANTEATIYAEYREHGSPLVVDDIASKVITTMVDGSTYLPLEEHTHVQCKLTGANERVERLDSTFVFSKTIRFDSLIQKT